VQDTGAPATHGTKSCSLTCLVYSTDTCEQQRPTSVFYIFARVDVSVVENAARATERVPIGLPPGLDLGHPDGGAVHRPCVHTIHTIISIIIVQ